MAVSARFKVLAVLIGLCLPVVAQAPPPGAGQTTDVYVKIASSEGAALPSGGTIDLKGADSRCPNLFRGRPILGGEATFQDIPVCKVKLDVVVTGFNVNRVKIDLRSYQKPMEIRIAKDGKAKVIMGPPKEGTMSRSEENPTH